MAEGKSNKTLIIFLIVLPILVASGFATAIIYTKGNIFSPQKEKKIKKRVEDFDIIEDIDNMEEDIIPNYIEGAPNYESFTLEGVTVNPKMNNTKGRLRILALNIGMQVKPLAVGVEEIQAKEVMIRDSINLYLSTKTVRFLLGDISNKTEMKTRIKNMANSILKKSRVMKITFPRYVVQ
ncbi:MAG: hypothetical protein CR982_03280 [Candidatus Cloacimonadota bacterium]|nr:MAG: hypothetical protein CR982_03280 [Candidatus Cloacimonadota bacterium]PIE77402.1 MAG: hypothetical protein CSA15_13050 [Candidatus Delongbacteria bacterium]